MEIGQMMILSISARDGLSMLDRLALDQLRILVVVEEAGSFSAAASRLGRVQSAVSQSVQALETALGGHRSTAASARRSSAMPAARCSPIRGRSCTAPKVSARMPTVFCPASSRSYRWRSMWYSPLTR
jgi:hypothetical protein